MDIYERIRYKREALDMSQEELAHKIGYKDRTAVSKMEAGQRQIKQSMIVKLASALDTTPAYLMGWDNEDDDATLAARLLYRYRALDDLDQELARRILKCDENFNKIG